MFNTIVLMGASFVGGCYYGGKVIRNNIRGSFRECNEMDTYLDVRTESIARKRKEINDSLDNTESLVNHKVTINKYLDWLEERYRN
jgi:hypothetical protein